MERKTMNTASLISLAILIASCDIPRLSQKEADMKALPAAYAGNGDSSNVAQLSWKEYFKDPYLISLIDTALQYNQELNIMLREIAIAQNEVKARKGEYLPFVGIRASAGAEKRSEHTPLGALEKNIPVRNGRENPEPMPDFFGALAANWELDIWGKLHNAARAAQMRYLSSVEGKNFMLTNLIAEIANSYYELLALDRQLAILNQNIQIQANALEVVRLQKQASRTTELAVRKFEAEVFKTKSMQYDIQQRITETENRINYLSGRYPQHIARNSSVFAKDIPAYIQSGLPAQLLANRPDIKQAELEMKAARLDIKVAKAKFYPSLGISANLGYQAFNMAYLISTPQSLIYSLAGDLAAPLINKKAIKAEYATATAKQVQSVYKYEQTLLNAYVEVANQLAKFQNLKSSIALKSRQVEALNQSIQISSDLFSSARADYMEVLMTQRDALESEFELIETQKAQMNTLVNLYRTLGGGWK